MFDAEISGLAQTRQEFDSAIKDSFGQAIGETVFDPVNTELHMLESEYSVAELKMNEAKMLMMELRTIV